MDGRHRVSQHELLTNSFQCGALQMQIFGHLDVLAATQTNFYLTDTLPPMIGHFFRGFTQNRLEEISTLQPLQIAMMGMGVGPKTYMEQYLGYQYQLSNIVRKWISHLKTFFTVRWSKLKATMRQRSRR